MMVGSGKVRIWMQSKGMNKIYTAAEILYSKLNNPVLRKLY